MTLKEELEKIWNELPCRFPLHLAAWLPKSTAQYRGVGHWILSSLAWTDLVSIKGKRLK